MKIRFFLFSCFFILTSNAHAVLNFSKPVLQKAYEQVNIRIEQKTNTVIVDENARKSIEQKKWALWEILASIDQAVKNHDTAKIREQAKLFRDNYREIINFIQNLKNIDTSPAIIHKNIPKIPIDTVITGKSTDITYYSDSFEWGKTSNGNPFSQAYFSAAACNIPFNTLVQVWRGITSVVAKVNDRPNCAKYPDLTDLTKVAFSSIGKISSGKFQGTINPLGVVTKGYIKKILATDVFKDLWITLDPGTPNTYLKNETFHITGKETSGKDHTILYMKSPSGKDITLGMKKKSDGTFEYNYPLEEMGMYEIVISSGLGFNTSIFSTITVLDDAIFSAKKLIASTKKVESLETIKTERIELPDLSSIYLFQIPSSDFHTLTLQSGTETFVFRGFGTIAIRGDTLKSIDPEKPVLVTLDSQQTSTTFSHDTYTTPVNVFTKTMTLTSGYKEEANEEITTQEVDGNLVIKGIVSKGKNVKSEIVLTLPDGNVEKYAFDTVSLDTDGYMKRAKPFTKTIALKQTGLYLVEVNYDNGFAAYNGPIVHGAVLPVLPNEYDSVQKKIGENDGSLVADDSLRFVNNVRAKSGKSALIIDRTLSALATIKANDMAAHNNLSHTDSNGVKIGGTAKQNNIKIAGSIGENIAGGNIRFSALLIGLANSGGHRANMLDNWTKMGVGYAVKDGQVYYVQVFGE